MNETSIVNTFQKDLSEIHSLQIDEWNLICKELQSEFGDYVYDNWLSKISCQSISGNKAICVVPTKFIREWIINNYKQVIEQKWNERNSQISSIEISVEHENGQDDEANIHQGNLASFSKAVDNAKDVTSLSLDPRFTFDNFVVGGSNELAYTAAYSVANSTEVLSECNPLFLYGGVGLGKTHLMHATAWHILKTSPERKVKYISAEKFMYEFIQALRNKEIMKFKQQFRSVDVLMIDDVQFICGKDSTQEEFFHTFNALIDNNCQLIISCDRSPHDLDGMEERIKSRLGWGLVADVHDTDYELRVGILQSKLEQMDFEVDHSVVELLAGKITSNVRELEGALNKVIAYSNLIKQPLTLSRTSDILKDLIRSNEKNLQIDDVIAVVARYYNIRASELSSARRVRNIARARQIAMFLSKKSTKDSLVNIGKKFGKKDHTTVMYAVRTIERLIENDSVIREDIQILERKLAG